MAVSLSLVICLSGCTTSDIFGGGDTTGGDRNAIMGADLSTDYPRVHSNDYTNLYLTISNPSVNDIYSENTYKISSSLNGQGIFKSYSPTTAQIADLLGVKEKTFIWKLDTPEVPGETQTEVLVHMNIDKSMVFTMPSITFATQDYVTAAQIRGSPIPEGPKTLFFQDNFVSVSVELSEASPVIGNKVYGNLKFTPIGDGIVILKSVGTDKGPCKEVDDTSKTAFCEFSTSTSSIKEEFFKLKVTYLYKLDKSYTFTILPPGGK